MNFDCYCFNCPASVFISIFSIKFVHNAKHYTFKQFSFVIKLIMYISVIIIQIKSNETKALES